MPSPESISSLPAVAAIHFIVDPVQPLSMDLQPWCEGIVSPHGVAIPLRILQVLQLMYMSTKRPECVKITTALRLKMSIQIIPDLNELSGIRSTVLEHQYLRSFTGGLLFHIQVDAGTGFGESLMGERPVEFLVQQSNDGVASTRNSHDSIRWLLSTQ
uniref:Uncharacterized protein n=1 Tax=Oryza rufipogon TaxID=4529 RepID=A0A0E0QAM7_ORYRU